MISLNSINTVCSSSTRSQKNKWLQKRGCGRPKPTSKYPSVYYDKFICSSKPFNEFSQFRIWTFNKKALNTYPQKRANFSQKYSNTSFIHYTKMKFSVKDFFSKCDQIGSFLRIWSHLLKKSLTENFFFCAVIYPYINLRLSK